MMAHIAGSPAGKVLVPAGERAVFSRRMPEAPWCGVRGATRAAVPGASRWKSPGPVRSGPFGGLVNRRAVCGRSARTVRREGRRSQMRRPYPYPGASRVYRVGDWAISPPQTSACIR